MYRTSTHMWGLSTTDASPVKIWYSSVFPCSFVARLRFVSGKLRSISPFVTGTFQSRSQGGASLFNSRLLPLFDKLNATKVDSQKMWLLIVFDGNMQGCSQDVNSQDRDETETVHFSNSRDPGETFHFRDQDVFETIKFSNYRYKSGRPDNDVF